MTTFGIDSSGFTIKRLADIIQDIGVALSEVQDPVSGEYLTPNLLDENDPLVLIVNAISDSLSVLWGQLQLAYNQFDPLKATGAGLSGLVQLNNLRRLGGTPATATFEITGTPNRVIPYGVQVGDMNDTILFTLPEITLDDDGEGSAIGTSTVNGPIAAGIGKIIKILTPVSGLDSVSNIDVSDNGTDDETDVELRSRQQLSVSNTARSVIDSVYGKLAGIFGVTHVRIFQNRTMTTDIRGIPPKSIAVVIMGGSDPYISQSIFNSVDCDTYGTTYTEQIDAQGILYPIYFSRPEEIDIFVTIEIEIVTAALWSEISEDNIKESIVAWATEGAEGIGITEGYDRDGYIPGESVYASELFTPINRQLGIRIVSVLVADSETPTENKVDIAWNEIANFDVDNISIVYFGESS